MQVPSDFGDQRINFFSKGRFKHKQTDKQIIEYNSFVFNVFIVDLMTEHKNLLFLHTLSWIAQILYQMITDDSILCASFLHSVNKYQILLFFENIYFK